MYDNPNFDSQNGGLGFANLLKADRRVLLYQNEIAEDPSLIYAPLDNPLIGYASQ